MTFVNNKGSRREHTHENGRARHTHTQTKHVELNQRTSTEKMMLFYLY